MTIRSLAICSAPGPWQMAADEFMLERALAGEASFRLYTWEPPAVSLGYFQKHAERLADPKLAAYPWVRRCTGGGAIIHDNDLTYAFAVTAATARSRTPLAWHNHFHEALAKVLRNLQVAAAVQVGARRGQEELGFSCFAVPQPGDIVVGVEKIVGGAQRQRRGALLQHGSIQVPGLSAKADVLATAIAADLKWDLVPAEWSALEHARIETLAKEKYSSAEWNAKR